MKKYKFWVFLLVVSVGLVVVGQGCGKSDSASSASHTIYGATS